MAVHTKLLAEFLTAVNETGRLKSYTLTERGATMYVANARPLFVEPFETSPELIVRRTGDDDDVGIGLRDSADIEKFVAEFL